MTHSAQSSVTKKGSRKFTRGPLAVTAAALIAVGALGLALGQDMRFASAEPAQTTPTPPPQTAQTPYGAVPLSFADLMQKVSPAVVSINVKGDSKVAENDLQIPGLPDLPEDNPLYDFFKQFRQGQPGQGGHPARPHPTLAQGSGFFISPDGYLVKVAVGPSNSGVFAQPAQSRKVGPGDMVVIPPGVYHGFTDIADHIDYVSVRVDPDRLLPSGHVHEVLTQK